MRKAEGEGGGERGGGGGEGKEQEEEEEEREGEEEKCEASSHHLSARRSSFRPQAPKIIYPTHKVVHVPFSVQVLGQDLRYFMPHMVPVSAAVAAEAAAKEVRGERKGWLGWDGGGWRPREARLLLSAIPSSPPLSVLI